MPIAISNWKQPFFWIYVGLGGVAVFGLLAVREARSALRLSGLQNARCPHGVRGGLPMNRCEKCRAEIATRAAAEAAHRHEEELRRKSEAQESERRRRADQARREEERRKRYETLTGLQRLNGTEFESFVANLFTADGYSVVHRGGSGDEGIDLILRVGGTVDVVQCKRWKNEIGSSVIREFFGSLIHAGARQGFVITTAGFTDRARSFAKGKPILLIDGPYLISWIQQRKRPPRGNHPQAAKASELDAHAVLGIPKGASPQQIQEAYRGLVTKYHPDKVSHLGSEFQEIAARKTLEINAAYAKLIRSGR